LNSQWLILKVFSEVRLKEHTQNVQQDEVQIG